ncbi:juvenile hormone esterase isoform X2 [Anabrus simplex]
MVWIHGGAFIFGSGNPNNFGPDFLVEKDVLVVLVNYRLGMLGFLNMHNKDVPGNMGLKDQVAALRWVQKNIAKFGGDPKQVTIFGESAGGVSAHFLMLSPMTKGLFQRVICQSGVSLNPWSFKLSVSENNKILLNFVGCGDLEGDELLKCLKEVPVEKLTQIPLVGLNTPTEEDKWVEIPLHVYVTVDDTFLPRAPRQILKDGDYNKVPLLLGINDAEGLLLFNIIMKHQTRLESFNDNMEKMVPRDLELKPGSKDSKEVANMIKDFYFDGKLTPEKADQYKDLSTDRLFLIGVHQAVQLHAATSDQPIYLYEFAFEGAFGITKAIFGSPLYQGVSHVEDVYYIHAVKNIPYKLFNFSPEMLTLRRMVTMWTNFAKFGNPTPEQSTLLPVTWRPYTPEDPAYLHIRSQLTVKRNIEERRMKFWDSVYERYANFTC